ncbi:MAG: N-acetylglutamate synthase ARgJ [Candidatus Methanohalarchaeum thermophilum]|uniref:Arginine biosynthesis bifunctional protein ArgJ n=1 Tax=Methanohalarchaeum thermophilum TaxID=1903181 RepID=A0A1Q6DVA9_METT1|nr:MAG: N-acetylglutamate synthase ARgJ [Candidatus Methanohalarchaeum thermophilum]
MVIKIKELDGGLTEVQGVKASGITKKGKGLAFIEGKGKITGVFTKNKVKAAPVRFTSSLLKNVDEIDNIILNSGCANAFTGEKGEKDVEWMSSLANGNTAICSTGAIGTYIDREWIQEGFKETKSSLTTDRKGSKKAAEAIKTTDTFCKEIAVEGSGYRIGAIAKGSGMIEPNMGTMLALIYTDLELGGQELDEFLKKSVRETFNLVVVDGETSTNDSALLVSTGKSNKTHEGLEDEFQENLTYVCRELAKMIAEDGEGSSKSITLKITKSKNREEARDAIKKILSSPLVKSAIYGSSPNLGRIIAALGRSKATFKEDEIEMYLDELKVIENGNIIADQEDIKEKFDKEDIKAKINLKAGNHSLEGWGCDLTPKYVEMNAGYI